MSSQGPLRVLGVGAGYFSQFQYQGWRNIEDAQCVGIVNRDQAKAQVLARRFDEAIAVEPWQNVHRRGSDAREGGLLLAAGALVGVVNGLGEDARRNRPDSRVLAWASDAGARRLCLRNAGRARAAPGVDDCAIGLWW